MAVPFECPCGFAGSGAENQWRKGRGLLCGPCKLARKARAA
ncbi:hypothetical protein U717_16610 [Rhodobacter capsulatus R121]|nr:hypothetical protein U714_16645 [Rhodobacter capsulatus DE442]ETD74895.1 hypothetical protein U717_16610 [Rhodobacter capsulatus R121]ETD83903.1 hypothetical protein U703_07620 [Rhodobacter capsulatus YW1]ETD87516.1 hypothetical protein U716_00920 [Rhodobacter capsulatus B6]ETD88897.1 hypothetical protein U713_11995 [Rhodobacter capsulatus YW2]ETE52636.1 hypothetical protein U715_16605 [Rhodobacter capsulatus Y262]